MNTNLKSNTVTISKPAAEVYAFLLNLNNHQQLMPSQAANWSSTEDEYQFTIPNTATIRVHKQHYISSELIQLAPTGDKIPFPFELNWHLEENNGKAYVRLEFRAEINAFLKMLVTGPLQNLLNHQAETLCKVLG